jgi:uncharacterized membrane protein (UPF0127 family)
MPLTSWLLAAFRPASVIAALVLAWPPAAVPALAQQAAGVPMRLPAETMAIVTAQGRFEFDVEIADETDEQQRGLMFRTDLPAKRGMLFDFGQTRMVTMWMRNTPLPLDMVFIRGDGTVANVAERTTPFSDDIVASGEPVAYVLELNGGIARMIGLKPGDKVEFPPSVAK